MPNGAWTGYYRYGLLLLKRKERMDLSLFFENGLIRGQGTDPVGDFEIQGHYQEDYQFTKQYLGQHAVLYQGRPKGTGLAGRWHIPHDWSGDFEIWPLEEEPSSLGMMGLPAP